MATSSDSKTALPLSKTWHGATYDGNVGFNNSDLVIKCQGHEFKVQKSAVCPQSPTIAAQMHGNWQESRTGVIEVEEFDAGTIERLLRYLYFHVYSAHASSKDVPLNASGCTETNRILLVHARVTAAADYYQIADMKEFAAQSFLDAAGKSEWSSLGFSEVIQVVYNILAPHDRVLRDMVWDLSMCHWTEVRSSTWFEETVTACGQWAYDIMRVREKIHDTTEDELKTLKARLNSHEKAVSERENTVDRQEARLKIQEAQLASEKSAFEREKNTMVVEGTGTGIKRRRTSTSEDPYSGPASPYRSVRELLRPSKQSYPTTANPHDVSNQKDRAGFTVANTQVIVPATAYRATYLNDSGVKYNGDSKIWPVNRLGRFEYMTADKKHGAIEPSKVKKIEWTKENFHVRLTGVAHTGKTYEVRIILEDENSFHDFRADCIRLRMVDPAKSSNWQEQSG